MVLWPCAKAKWRSEQEVCGSMFFLLLLLKFYLAAVGADASCTSFSIPFCFDLLSVRDEECEIEEERCSIQESLLS